MHKLFVLVGYKKITRVNNRFVFLRGKEVVVIRKVNENEKFINFYDVFNNNYYE